MSVADSSNLIDSPPASKLGLHRACSTARTRAGWRSSGPTACLPTPGWLTSSSTSAGRGRSRSVSPECEQEIRVGVAAEARVAEETTGLPDPRQSRR